MQAVREAFALADREEEHRRRRRVHRLASVAIKEDVLEFERRRAAAERETTAADSVVDLCR